MKLTIDMVPVKPDGSLDRASWTYRALKSQDEWGSNPSASVNGFFKLVLTPMVRALFNDAEADAKEGPPQYWLACQVLSQWVEMRVLNWDLLPEQFVQIQYPKLRRMLEWTRYYRALFECKPGGLQGAWKQFFVASGCGTAEEAELSSDLKTLFMLHISIGPRVEKVDRNRIPPRRPTGESRRTRDDAETQFVTTVQQPLVDFLRDLTELFREFSQLDPQDLQTDLAWTLEQLRGRLESRGDPPDPYADEVGDADEEVRILEPAFVVDFEPDPNARK
jgi:hypothetical protein